MWIYLKNYLALPHIVAFVLFMPFCSVMAASQLDQYYAHQTTEDEYGVISPWHNGQNGALDNRLRIAVEVFKRYPWVGNDKAIMAAPHMLYNTHWSISDDGNITPQGAGGGSDLGQITLSVIQGLTKYYRYSGDPYSIVYIKLFCDYILDYALTPSDHPWPEFPISVAWSGEAYGRCNPDVPNQLDLCALMGIEMLRAYKLTGNERYFNAAQKWGDVFAAKCNFADKNLPPWNRYANPEFTRWSDELTGTTAFICQFLDELIRMEYTGVDRILIKARDAGDDFIKNDLLPRWTDNEAWGRHYWDWEGAVSTGSIPWICEYFMSRPQVYSNWRNDVRNILALPLNRNTVNPISMGGVYSGAWAIPESFGCCGTSLSYNQYTYSPVFIHYGIQADDELYREIGRRMILMASYDSNENGVVFDGVEGKKVVAGGWLNLSHPWPFCQIFKVLALMPDVFGPGRENHIMDSTSVVNSVIYSKGNISYSTFDAPSNNIDVLRLSFAPSEITADGAKLDRRSELSRNGYTVRDLNNGDFIVQIRHDEKRNIVIKGDDPQKMADDNAFTYEGNWQVADRDQSFGGKLHTASEPKAAISYSFTGNQLRLIGSVDDEGGLADVYLDGEKQLTLIDCWNPAPKNQQLLYFKNDLSNDQHNLKIIVRGKGNLISKGQNIYIDALQYSDAVGDSGFGSGGGPVTTQRMIMGYAGRNDYIDSKGNSWRPSSEFVIRLGRIDAVEKAWWTQRRSMFIGNTSDPELFRYGIHGKEFSVNVTVGPGDYYVKLFFADTNTNAALTACINGQEVIKAMNVAESAGGRFKAYEEVFFDILPKNGIIEINFTGVDDKEASVQAIEVGPMAIYKSGKKNG